MADGATPPTELALQPFDRDELAELIETIEGEPVASVLLLVAERSRGNALVAEELLAARRELAGASLTGSLDELVWPAGQADARVPADPAPRRAGRRADVDR